MSIHDTFEKINRFGGTDKGKDILTVIIIILVGLGSFGLGRLSKNPPKEGLKIEYKGAYIDSEANILKATENTSQSQNSASSGNFFASSKGTKYYSTGCSAGKTIKQENRIYFSTRGEAESAGYELSSSCR